MLIRDSILKIPLSVDLSRSKDGSPSSAANQPEVHQWLGDAESRLWSAWIIHPTSIFTEGLCLWKWPNLWLEGLE